MTIGERIKSQRKSIGISQTELAKRVNISKQTLYKYETNIIVNIPSDKIEEIAKVLRVSPSYLMGWNDKPNITDVLANNLFHYLKEKLHSVKFNSTYINLEEVLDSQNEGFDKFMQKCIKMSAKELRSILDGKHIPTPEELTNILYGLNIPIEQLLSLPYPPPYNYAKYNFIHAALSKNNYTLCYTHDKNVLLLGINGNAYEINVAAYDTFVSSIDDYISLNLKQLTLNGKRNPELDAALDSLLD